MNYRLLASFVFTLTTFGTFASENSPTRSSNPELLLGKSELTLCGSDSDKQTVDWSTLKTKLNVETGFRIPGSEKSERRIYIVQQASENKFGIADTIMRGLSFETKEGKLGFGFDGCKKVPAVDPEVIEKYHVYRLKCREATDVDATFIFDVEKGKMVYSQLDERKAESSIGPFKFNKKSNMGVVSCKDKELDLEVLNGLLMGKVAYQKLQDSLKSIEDALRANGIYTKEDIKEVNDTSKNSIKEKEQSSEAGGASTNAISK